MKELDALKEYIEKHNIRKSVPREKIIKVFLSEERHLTINDLYLIVQKKYPDIGIATVYRAMKIACDAGLARETDFGDGNTRYEHLFGHEHHDHLICMRCGKFVEIKSEKIESEQNAIAAFHGYTLLQHRHTLYGICTECRK